MENFQNIYSSCLPLEIVNKILFEFKGMQHPVASIMKQYWEKLDEQYNLYFNIEHIITRKHIDHEEEAFTVTTEETYREIYQDYPRLFFAVEYDFVETIIYDLYDDGEEEETVYFI